MTAKKRPCQETAGIHLMVGFHGANIDEELKFIISPVKGKQL
jgi:hypothetical protein